MGKLLIVVLMIVALADSITGRYPDCVDCTNGSIPLMPLSYNTIRSHVFSGTQPSNGGCTNGPSVDGQVTIDCGLGTALVDCDSDLNQEIFSNLSDTPIFTWNKTALSSNEVPVVFKFDQQVNVAVIRMYFWSSLSDSVTVPNIKVYWSDEDFVTPSNEFVITHRASGGDTEQQVLTIHIWHPDLKFRYLRIKMSFADSCQWIVLSEVEFCGTTAPYHITQPTANQNVRIISSMASTANVTFSLNVTISHDIIITWLYNGSDIVQTSHYDIIQAGNTTTLLITDPQPSDAGVYQCVANDNVSGWTLRRVIILVIQSNCTQLSSSANGQIVPCSSNAARGHYETCQNNGNRSGSESTCKRVYCDRLPNGVINCTSDATMTAITASEADTCRFCCNAGYYALQGSANRICISEEDPFCITAEIINSDPNGNGTIESNPTDNEIDSDQNDTATENISNDNDTDTINICSGSGAETRNTSSGNVSRDDIQCEYYNSTGVCSEYLSEFDHPVKFALSTNRSFSDSETEVIMFVEALHNLDIIHGHCNDTLLRFVCRWVYFPTCDPACNVPVSQHICRRACEILTIFECPEVWKLYLQLRGILDVPQGRDSSTCNNLIYANGGDIPDCTDPLDGDKIPAFSVTTDCFNGRGRGYNGTINVTRSGKTCQHWSVQAPHQFILPSSQYPELGDHNYCRNPGSRAPEGPWCFTTDSNTRWEYCNVPKCDPSASCELYHSGPNTTAVCFGFGLIGRDYVFVNNSVDTMDDLNSKLIKLNHTLHRMVETRGYPEECIDIILGLMCHHSFPLCDHGSDTPVPRKVCRSYCDKVSTMKCGNLWKHLENSSDVTEIIEIPDCKTLPSSEGGDYLECYIPCNNGRGRYDDSSSTNCYTEDDLGIRYNGTVSVTVSGRECQHWDSDTPHFHPITSQYRPYLEGHNHCRNPEGRGKRPWCYTNDSSVRWEYCNVPVCPKANNNISFLTVVTFAAPTLILIVLVIVIVLLLSMCVWTIKKKKEPVVSLYVSHDNDIDNTSTCDNEYVLGLTATAAERLPNYPRENFTYICDLGQGNYGTVIKGEAKDIIPNQSSTLVATKVLKEGSNSDSRSDFIHEADLVNQFDHPNILKLLGVCFDREPFYIIFEYMDLGDLNNYLRNAVNGVGPSSSNLTVQKLVDMAINIAAGLEYLAVRRFVHRDLATRNCLINENFVVKIADFGLSKDVYSKDYYRMDNKSVLPIRWMPPEAILYCKFSTQSDIWSFGIVLWEIFSCGAQPYCALSNEEVVDYVTKKNVLRCPNGCPSELYDLMVNCWTSNPKKRPMASEVHAHLQSWNSSNARSPREQGEDFDTASPNQLILETTV